MGRGGRRSTTFNSTWKHGKTRTIRVPIALAEEILKFAKELDEGVTQANKLDSEKVDQGAMFKLMDDFIESLQGRSGGNQYKSKGEVQTAGTRWYFFNKFKKWMSNGWASSFNAKS